MFNGLNRHYVVVIYIFISMVITIGLYKKEQRRFSRKDIQILLAYFNLHTLRSHKSDR